MQKSKEEILDEFMQRQEEAMHDFDKIFDTSMSTNEMEQIQSDIIKTILKQIREKYNLSELDNAYKYWQRYKNEVIL